MPRNRFFLLASLTCASAVMACQTYSVSAADGAIDDLPTVCALMPKLPNGKLLTQHLESSQKPQLHQLQSGVTLEHIRLDERRYKLAKSVAAVQGRALTSAPTLRRHVITGSVDARQEPGGKVIDSLPGGFVVLVEGEKGEWAFIRGYWDQPCATGWVPRKSLRPYQ